MEETEFMSVRISIIEEVFQTKITSLCCDNLISELIKFKLCSLHNVFLFQKLALLWDEAQLCLPYVCKKIKVFLFKYIDISLMYKRKDDFKADK